MNRPITLAHIADKIINRPLLIHPGKVPLILQALSGRLSVDVQESVDPQLIDEVSKVGTPQSSRFVGTALERTEGGYQRALPYKRTEDGVAIVSTIGSLVNRGAWIGAYSGMVSYEGIKHQMESAARDPRVKSIILDLESPGGEAVGMNDAAGVVASVARQKPVTAIVNGMAASAAYGLASQASRIVTSETGISGSVGVVLVHADYSKFLDEKGIATTLIYAGAHKVDGHPFGPLPDSVADDLQAEVDNYYSMFVSLVAKGRAGMSTADVRKTEARTYVGASAVDVGLADEVSTFEKVFAAATRDARRTISTTKGTNTMPNNNGRAAADMDPAAIVFTHEQVEASCAAAATAARAEGADEGRAEGRSAERDRLRAVLAIEGIAGHELQAINLAVESPDMSVEAIGRFVMSLPAATIPSVANRSSEATIGGTGKTTQGAAVADAWKSTVDAVNKRRGFDA